MDTALATLESVDDASRVLRDSPASIVQSLAGQAPEPPSPPRSRVSSASSDAIVDETLDHITSHAVLLLPEATDDVPRGDDMPPALNIVRASVLQPRRSYVSLLAPIDGHASHASVAMQVGRWLGVVQDERVQEAVLEEPSAPTLSLEGLTALAGHPMNGSFCSERRSDGCSPFASRKRAAMLAHVANVSFV